MKFGDKVKTARTRAGMTQEELAAAMHKSLRTITNYETGGRYPKSHSTYQELADILHVDVNYLMTEDEPAAMQIETQLQSGKNLSGIIDSFSALFSGGEFSWEDKDELMQGITDAYWMARKKERSKEKEES